MLTGEGPFQRFARRRWKRVLEELTPEACRSRNEVLPDRADVRYLSYAGVRLVEELPLWMRSWGQLIAQEEGDNDGLVSLASTRWGDSRDTVRADHLELIGWSLAWPNMRNRRPFPHLDLYRQIIAEVQQESTASVP